MKLLLTVGPTSIVACLLNEWLNVMDALSLDSACASKTTQSFLHTCYKQVTWPRKYVLILRSRHVQKPESFVDMMYWLQVRGIAVCDDAKNHNQGWLELTAGLISTLLYESRNIVAPFVKSLAISDKTFGSNPHEVIQVVTAIFPNIERVRVTTHSVNLDILSSLLSHWKIRVVDYLQASAGVMRQRCSFLACIGDSLEEVSLQHTAVLIEDIQLIAAACGSSLQRLLIGATIEPEDTPSILAIIGGFRSLKTLHLRIASEHLFTIQDAHLLVSQLRQLSSIIISFQEDVSARSTYELELFHCFLSKCPHLIDAHLPQISYQEDDTKFASFYTNFALRTEDSSQMGLVIDIFRCLPRLDELVLGDWTVFYENVLLVTALTSYCPEVLRNVSRCELALESTDQLPIIAALLLNLPSLTHLTISSCQFDSEAEIFSPECCRTLVQHSRGLQSLSLYCERGSGCRGFSDISMRTLLDGLPHLRKFELNLSCSKHTAVQSLAVIASYGRVWDYLGFTHTLVTAPDLCEAIDQYGLLVKRVGFSTPSVYVGSARIPLTSKQFSDYLSRLKRTSANAPPIKYNAM